MATTGLSRETVAGSGTMKALRFHAAKALRVEEVARPGAPDPGEVPVRNRGVGICGTDRHASSCEPIRLPKTRPVAS